MVQHEHEGVALARGGNDIAELGVLERLCPHNDALVGTVAGELVQAVSGHALDGDAGGVQALGKAFERRVRIK